MIEYYNQFLKEIKAIKLYLIDFKKNFYKIKD